jgi:hypothetical protein
MQSIDSGWLPSGAGNRSLNVVYKPFDNTTDFGIIGWGDTRQYVLYRYLGGEPFLSIYPGPGYDVSSGAAYTAAAKAITFTFTAGNQLMYRDGVDVTPGTHAPGIDTSAGPLVVGKAVITYSEMSGYVSEATVFSSVLSTTDRHTLERSQGTAFGITVS